MHFAFDSQNLTPISSVFGVAIRSLSRPQCVPRGEAMRRASSILNIKSILFITAAWFAIQPVPAYAQNISAIGSGNWENASIWSGGIVPNSSNNVYIGSSDYPAAGTATITLTGSESVNSVYIGYGSPTNGVLNL